MVVGYVPHHKFSESLQFLLWYKETSERVFEDVKKNAYLLSPDNLEIFS